MADTAVVEHDEGLEGGTLTLFRENGAHRLVLAAPRAGLPEHGVVAVYGQNRLVAKLSSSESTDGQLSLRVSTGAETVLLDAGTEDGRLSGRLVLKNHEQPGAGQMDLGFDEHGPLLVLASRDEGGGGRIELGFDEDGPYLKLIKPVAGFQP